jgi:hypothetical protein
MAMSGGSGGGFGAASGSPQFVGATVGGSILLGAIGSAAGSRTSSTPVWKQTALSRRSQHSPVAKERTPMTLFGILLILLGLLSMATIIGFFPGIALLLGICAIAVGAPLKAARRI